MNYMFLDIARWEVILETMLLQKLYKKQLVYSFEWFSQYKIGYKFV